ncbi:MAG: hypothetical protein NPIRA02_04520 [Nitrospirales bacterium]|nr:MAG: hypothetical protein NPIRA02_04520 [Nitrospirales bacterium]
MKRLLMMGLLTGVLPLFSFWMIPDVADARMYIVSRANCINNESITWDPDVLLFGKSGLPRDLAVNSYHYDITTLLWHCQNNLSNECTTAGYDIGVYRSAAIHVGEGLRGGYMVYGIHWATYVIGGVLGTTITQDCGPPLGF